MTITHNILSDKINEFLSGTITNIEFAHWAENAMLEGDYEEAYFDIISDSLARIGVVDVNGFELTENDYKEIMKKFKSKLTDLKIIKEIEKLVSETAGENIELERIEEIVSDKKGYKLDVNGKVIGISLYECNIRNLKQISEKLSLLENLEILKLRNNKFIDISCLSGLTKLTDLNLRYNSINDISPLQKLTNIKILDLSFCKITDISFLQHLQQIEHLHLTDNSIKDISVLKHLLTIKELGLLQNKIENIDSLKNLTQLTKLDLGSNPISDISSLKLLLHLEWLNITQTRNKDITVLRNLKKLKHISLGYNHIEDISILQFLPHITELYLPYNVITDISPIKYLVSLIQLDLENNVISDLSPLMQLTKLTYINLSGNRIKYFPKELLELQCEIYYDEYLGNKDKAIELGGNPIENIPIEIIKQRKEAIKQYFIEQKTVLSNEKIEKLSIKNFRLIDNLEINLSKDVTIILGNNGFGKTTILQSLVLAILQDKIHEVRRLDFQPYIKFDEIFSEFKIQWNKDLYRHIFLYETGKKTQNGSCGANLILLVYGANIFTRSKDMNYKDIVEKLVGGSEKKLYRIASLFDSIDDTFFDPKYIFDELESAEFQDEENRQEIKELKTTLLEKLNFLIPEDIQIKKERTAYHFFNQQGDKLALNQLSEGYRTAILLLTDILIRIMSVRNQIKKYISDTTASNIFDKAFGVVAIDEFDRHLHPTWQLVYIDKLKKVLPNMQLVLTTHNPLSILNREEDEVLQLIVDEDTKKLGVMKYKGGTKNMDVVMVLLKYFDVNYVVSQSYREKIDRYYYLSSKKQRNETENTEFQILKEELKTSLIGMGVPDYKYHKFIEFIHSKNIDLRKLEHQNKLNFNDMEWNELANIIQ